jgi:uncharacterized protein (DUF58 family)
MSLSGRAYLLIALTVLLAVVDQWTDGGFAQPWRYAAAFLLCALLLEWIRARHDAVRVRHHFEPELALGERGCLTVEIDNQTSRPLRIDTQFRLPAVLSGDEALTTWRVPARATVSRNFPVIPTALGTVTPGLLYSRMRGHLGLAWWSRRVCCATESLVVPSALERREAGAGQAPPGAQQAHGRQGSGDNLLALRDYQPGDPPRTIDWKATARRGRTTVRVCARDQRMNLLLIIDAGRTSCLQAGALTRLHHYVNIAARLAQLATLQGDNVGLMGFSSEPLETVALAPGMSSLPAVRESLGRLRSAAGDFNPLMAALAACRMLRQRGLVVFLCEIEQHAAATQLARACRLLTPKHLALVASLVDGDVRDIETQRCETWLDPYRRLAALEYARSRRSAALNLRRLGTEVVMSDPGDLDRKLMQRYRRLRQRQRV